MLRFSSAIFLLAAFCPLAPAAVDSGLLALAPSGSQMVGAMDVDGSRNSAFGQFFLGQISAHENGFQQMIEQTGFDPRRDLQSVLFTAVPPQGSGTQGSFAVIARGSFDQNRIKNAAQKGGSVLQQFQGVDLFVNKSGSNQTAFGFPDVGLAVMGDIASVKQVIQNRANPTVLDPALQEQIANVGSNNAWFASIVPASSLSLGTSYDAAGAKSTAMDSARVLQAVIRSSGGISFGPSANLMFNAVARSPQDAAALADVMRFVVSMLQTQSGNNPQAAQLAPALNSMKLNTDGSSVHVSLQLPESTLEQMLKQPAGSTSHSMPAHGAH